MSGLTKDKAFRRKKIWIILRTFEDEHGHNWRFQPGPVEWWWTLLFFDPQEQAGIVRRMTVWLEVDVNAQ